jgi:hypothetical protein
MGDNQFLTDAITSVRSRLTQLVALLEPTMDHEFVMTEAIANVRGHLIHLESLLETDDDHIMPGNGNGNQSLRPTLPFPTLRPGTTRIILISPIKKLDRHICPTKIHHDTLAPLQPQHP